MLLSVHKLSTGRSINLDVAVLRCLAPGDHALPGLLLIMLGWCWNAQERMDVGWFEVAEK